MIFNMSTGGASTADKVKYNNTESGLKSTDVQGAIDEVNSSLNFKYNYETDYFQTLIDGVWINWRKAGFKNIILFDEYGFSDGYSLGEPINFTSSTILDGGFQVNSTPFYLYEVAPGSGDHVICSMINGGIDLSLYSKMNVIYTTNGDEYTITKDIASINKIMYIAVCLQNVRGVGNYLKFELHDIQNPSQGYASDSLYQLNTKITDMSNVTLNKIWFE